MAKFFSESAAVEMTLRAAAIEKDPGFVTLMLRDSEGRSAQRFFRIDSTRQIADLGPWDQILKSYRSGLLEYS